MPITDRIAADLPATIKTASYSILPDDFGREIQFQSASPLTAYLMPTGEAGNGYNLILRNVGTGMLTIQPAGPELIDGQSSVTLDTGAWRWIRSDGTEWKSVARAGDGSGTVTEVDTDGGLTGGPITSTGTISIADGGVTEQKIANGAVTTPKIGDNSITTPKIVDGAVGTPKLNDDAVTLGKMASGTAGNLISYDAGGDPVAVATGNAGEVLTSNGAGAAPTFQTPSSGGGLMSMQVFTSSGTWAKPAGISRVKVTVVGGGGSGGNSDQGDYSTSGGAAGGGSQMFIDVSGVASVSVTIGAGGAGVGPSAAIGNAGGTSSFGAYCSATGGAGGIYSSDPATNIPPTTPGSGTGGDINISGGYGTATRYSSSQAVKGFGGATPFGLGFGGVPYNNPQGTGGVAGNGYGSGGSASASFVSSEYSGAGTSGIVIVEEYA